MSLPMLWAAGIWNNPVRRSHPATPRKTYRPVSFILPDDLHYPDRDLRLGKPCTSALVGDGHRRCYGNPRRAP